jgi:protein-disulfide isomerase/uncharacterized membrane protein
MPSSSTSAVAAPRAPVARVGPGAFLAGAAFLGVAVVASGAMSFASLRGISLPGCGKGSPCASVASGPWGNIPIGGMLWPVSYLGLAYFAGMLGAWVATRGASGAALRWVAAIGALASAMFIGIMLASKAVCPWCMGAHLANFGFVAVLAVALRPELGLSLRPMVGAAALAGVFVATTGVLAVADSTMRTGARQVAQKDLNAFMAEVNAKNRENQGETPVHPVTSVPPQAPQPPAAQPPERPKPTPAPVQAANAQVQPPAPAPAPPAAAQPAAALPAAQPFTGRYRFGPEKAAVRVVAFTDYQCPDCKKVEAQLEEALAKHPSISLSIRHFPFCTDCNPNVPNLHRNACWAARAAETAGMMGGNQAYQKMHGWLFEKGGVFTTREEIEGAARMAGLDAAAFVQMMSSDAPLKNIQADIADAIALGIGSTPFIFINGVEFKGWQATPTAVADAIATIAATKPPVLGPENDRPMRAFAKFIQEWREQNQMAWPSRPQPYAIGPATAPVKVTVFGDLQERYTAEADKQLRDYIAGRPDVRYEFRYFPVDPACNPGVPQIPGAAGCRAAKAAEAAGQLGGDNAYWAVHKWITANQSTFGDAGLRTLAGQIGINADALLAKMDSPEVANTIATDVSIGKRIQIPSIPRIFVNGKVVPRWKIEGGGVLETIIEEAGQQRPPAPQPNAPVVDPVLNNPLIKQLQNQPVQPR